MIREYRSEDYPMLLKWWQGHGWQGVPEAILPKLGVVWEDDGRPVAAAWLYMDNSIGVCMLEWLVADPEAPGKAVLTAIRHITRFLQERASELNYNVMLTTCRQESLARVYEKIGGFTRTDDGMIHLIKIWEAA
jgi:hypothetical protein